MAREELQAASEALRQAAELADNDGLEERVYNQSLEIAKLATADRGPDQGRLDRHRNVLSEIEDTAAADVAELVAEAKAHLRSYREGVGGI
jgi:hypothetical protein